MGNKEIDMGTKQTFISRQNRDARARELKAQGHSVLRRSVRNQICHPQYIADYTSEYETGFGNTDYRTAFGALYIVEVVS